MASRPRSTTDPALIAEVHAVYDEVAARPVERDCQRRTECCQFLLTGRVPHLTRGEAVVAAKAIRASGRTSLPKRNDGACPMLDAAGRCMIYSARPFGCRTHFCAAAGGPYARREVLDLIRRLEHIDHQLGGDGPHPLPTALRLAGIE